MSQYTDMLGNPIDVGSIVTYTTLRYKSAHQGFAVIEDFVELIERPCGRQPQWHSTGPNSRIPYIRKDQERQHRPTEFYVSTDDKGRPRPDKMFVARTRELRHQGNGRFTRTDARLGNRCSGELIALDKLVRDDAILDPENI